MNKEEQDRIDKKVFGELIDDLIEIISSNDETSLNNNLVSISKTPSLAGSN